MLRSPAGKERLNQHVFMYGVPLGLLKSGAPAVWLSSRIWTTWKPTSSSLSPPCSISTFRQVCSFLFPDLPPQQLLSAHTSHSCCFGHGRKDKPYIPEAVHMKLGKTLSISLHRVIGSGCICGFSKLQNILRQLFFQLLSHMLRFLIGFHNESLLSQKGSRCAFPESALPVAARMNSPFSTLVPDRMKGVT